MSYYIQPNEIPAVGIKRLALEQSQKALDSLQNPDTLDEGVHDARKRFKKVRAAARLVRDEVGADVYHQSNVVFRDAGRLLSDLRDSQVLIETVDDLRAQYDDVLASDAFSSILQKLVKRHDHLFSQIRNEKTIEQVIETVHNARLVIEAWPIESEDFSAFSKGLKRVYKRGQKRMHRAIEAPTTENLHEWRKRIKYLWYHVRILQKTWPNLLKELAETTHSLSNLLGDEHDLAVLRQTLEAEPDLTDTKMEQQALLGLISQRRKQLQTKAWPLAQRLYPEKPTKFVERLEQYWQAMKAEQSMSL